MPKAKAFRLTELSYLITLSDVTVSELKRWLKKQGCTFTEGTKHTKVALAGKITRMPRHPSRELKAKTLRTILRDLGLKI